MLQAGRAFPKRQARHQIWPFREQKERRERASDRRGVLHPGRMAGKRSDSAGRIKKFRFVTLDPYSAKSRRRKGGAR